MARPALTLSESQLRELIELTSDLFDEAGRCASAGLWRAAVLLLGGAVEAALIATAASLEPELRRTGAWPSNADPTSWTLGQALQVAKAASWLPSGPSTSEDDVFAALHGDIGDAVRFLLVVRNMVVHPGAYVLAEDRPDLDDAEHMRPTYDVLNGIAAEVWFRLHAALESPRSG